MATDYTIALAQLIKETATSAATGTARGTVVSVSGDGTVTFSVGSYTTPRKGIYLGPGVPQVGDVIVYFDEGSGFPLVLGATGPRDLSIDATKAFIVGNSRLTTAGLTVNGVSYTPTTWTAATLLNGWSHYGNGYHAVGYRKVGDVVEMRGVAAGGTIGAPSPSMLLMPTGFRPVASLMFAAIAGNALGRINVNPDGNCYCEIGTNTFVSFDTVSFSTV
jgi:hypothetical protein